MRSIEQLVQSENALTLLKAGEFYKSARLQRFCLDFIEENFLEFVHDPSLLSFIEGDSTNQKHLRVFREDFLEKLSLESNRVLATQNSDPNPQLLEETPWELGGNTGGKKTKENKTKKAKE